MTVNLIRKPELAVREIVETRLRSVMRADIKIQHGPGADEFNVHNKKLCIMEATAYVLGYSVISDTPPCTSESLRRLMVCLNDSEEMTDRLRAQLKKVIPAIVNTAPTKWRKMTKSEIAAAEYEITWNNAKGPVPTHKLITARNDEDYRRAEKERRAILGDEFKQLGCTGRYNPGSLADALLTKKKMPEVLDFIQRLAEIAKFEGDQKTPAEGVAA